jgi:membrane protein implicated in regulation of membrane protease activity
MTSIFLAGFDLSTETRVAGVFMAVLAVIAFISNPEGFYVLPGAIFPWTGLALTVLILGCFSWLQGRSERKLEAETSKIPA